MTSSTKSFTYFEPDSNGILWIKVQYKWRKALPGFELLALLFYADWHLWKKGVRAVMPALSREWEALIDDQRPTTTIGINLPITGDQESDELQEMAVMARHKGA